MSGPWPEAYKEALAAGLKLAPPKASPIKLKMKTRTKTYVARVRFGIRVRVRVRDSAIFEKGGCGCGGTRQLKNIFIYIFNILLSIFFHIIQTYTKFKSNSR